MAKLAIAAAIFLVCLLRINALPKASSFRTIVTTTMVEEEIISSNQGGGSQMEECRQKIEQQAPELEPCRYYLGRSRVNMIDMYVNHNNNQGQQQEQQQQMEQIKEKCCQKLKNIMVGGRQCSSCQALNEVVRDTFKEYLRPGRGGPVSPLRQQILDKAKNLPSECNFGQQCQIQTPFQNNWACMHI